MGCFNVLRCVAIVIGSVHVFMLIQRAGPRPDCAALVDPLHRKR